MKTPKRIIVGVSNISSAAYGRPPLRKADIVTHFVIRRATAITLRHEFNRGAGVLGDSEDVRCADQRLSGGDIAAPLARSRCAEREKGRP